MAYDLGGVATLAIQIRDAAGVLANATSVVATITLPDGSTATPSVVNSPTGTYTVAYATTQFGRHSIRWVATGTNAGAYTDTFDVEDPSELGLVSLADARAHLTIPTADTSRDDDIRRVILAATSLCEGFTGSALRRQTVVETHNGADFAGGLRGRHALRLLKSPVISVTSVVENGVTLAATDYTLSSRSGVLYRGTTTTRMSWYPGLDNVVVTYVAGYVNPPEGVVWACKKLIQNLWDKSLVSAHPAFNPDTGDEYAPATTYALPYAVQTALEPYVDHGI